MTVLGASLSARPLYPTSNGLLVMSGGVYIHDMTPDMARQWVEVLTKYAEENNA